MQAVYVMSIFNYVSHILKITHGPCLHAFDTCHCEDELELTGIFKELDAYHHYVDEEADGHHDDALRYLEVWMCSDGVGSHCKWLLIIITTDKWQPRTISILLHNRKLTESTMEKYKWFWENKLWTGIYSVVVVIRKKYFWRNDQFLYSIGYIIFLFEQFHKI